MVKFYKELPPWAKGVVGVVVVGVGAIAVFTVYQSIKKARQYKRDNVAAIEAEKELNGLLNAGARLSYGPSQYNTFVQKLVEAMNGCGTDEAKIYTVFEAMKSKVDVLKLISAFGIQVYEVCPLQNPISAVRDLIGFGKDAGGGLIAWINYDLGNSEIAKINDILRKKNIDYKF